MKTPPMGLIYSYIIVLFFVTLIVSGVISTAFSQPEWIKINTIASLSEHVSDCENLGRAPRVKEIKSKSRPSVWLFVCE